MAEPPAAHRNSESGRVLEALPLTKRLVETRKRTLSEEHPDTLHLIYNLKYFQEKVQEEYGDLQKETNQSSHSTRE